MLHKSTITILKQINGYKWIYKTSYKVTIIVSVSSWFLVVYFPNWRKPVGFRQLGKSKKTL